MNQSLHEAMNQDMNKWTNEWSKNESVGGGVGGWGQGRSISATRARFSSSIKKESEREVLERVNKSKNAGWTSVDRSTKATLSTYNTWIRLSRLQKIYHFQSLKLRLTTKPLTVEAVDMQQGRDLMLDM